MGTKMQNMFGSRSQSAMEYLMTYGWAILIIAVVLGALYYLGVFGSATSGPRAQPGSCRVFRPNGPSTTTFINLAGVCTGQLPQFVGSFNGQNSYINAGSAPSLLPNIFTVTAWVKYSTSGPITLVGFTGIGSLPILSPYWSSTYGGIIYLGPSNYRYFKNSPVNTADGNWHFVAFVITGNGQYDIANSIMYADGQVESLSTGTVAGSPSTKSGPFIVGSGNGYLFPGSISNVQIYNTSLDASTIQSLYVEGIGGAPQALNNLVGWWPLNGNAQDYSGNNNNGAATSVTYTSSWTSGYQGH